MIMIAYLCTKEIEFLTAVLGSYDDVEIFNTCAEEACDARDAQD